MSWQFMLLVEYFLMLFVVISKLVFLYMKHA
jgi:hypothetical protein